MGNQQSEQTLETYEWERLPDLPARVSALGAGFARRNGSMYFIEIFSHAQLGATPSLADDALHSRVILHCQH